MKPVDFMLHRPRTLDEAVSLLAERPEDSKVLAGGQSLVPLLNFRLARPEHLIDLSLISSLAILKRTPTELIVGAMVRQSQAEKSAAVAESVPLLAAALPNIAHPPIRSRGTIGGSIAHADPAAELPSVVRALDATLVAVGPRGRREIPASEFFASNLVTALSADEILVEIRFATVVGQHTGAAFEEVSRRQGDFALVGAGAQVALEGARIAKIGICLTGVSSTPWRASTAERILSGSALSNELIEEAMSATREELHPLADLHATSEYRRDVAGELVRRAVTAAHDRARSAAA